MVRMMENIFKIDTIVSNHDLVKQKLSQFAFLLSSDYTFVEVNSVI